MARRLPTDTSVKMADYQVLLLRKVGVAERVARIVSLSTTVMELSHNAIARANPGVSEADLKAKIAEHFYDKRLAKDLYNYLIQSK